LPAQTPKGFVPQMCKKGRLQVGRGAGIVLFDPARGRRVTPTDRFIMSRQTRRRQSSSHQ
jgi:hypothetical protein